MTTSAPLALRKALMEERERRVLVDDLARAGITTHDNVVDLVLATARAGSTCAIYLLQAGARHTSSVATTRMAYAMDRLWNEQAPPIAGSKSRTLKWLDHCLVTLAAFDPWSDDYLPSLRLTNVGIFDAEWSDAMIKGQLVSSGRDLARRAGYDSADEARRARTAWTDIEALNGAQTAAGNLALSRLAGRLLDSDKLAAFSESTSELDTRSREWYELNVAPDEHTTRGGYLVHSAGPPSAIDLFRYASRSEESDPGGLMIVWYGTDREPSEGAAGLRFTNRPSEPSRMHYGQCVVSVPMSHRFGEVRTPLWDRIVRGTGDGRLRLEGITPAASADAFASSIDAVFDHLDDPDRTATVFVHGYNTSFEDAAIRAAQMGFDLRTKGITALFSWPSAARWSRYLSDADNVELSQHALEEFLDTLLSRTTVTHVNFIVHSMGNRLVIRTLESFAPSLHRIGVSVGAIVLAAPDINVRMFEQLAYVYPSLSTNATMYVSEADKALAVSYRGVWRNPRAGFTPPVTIVPGVHTIEVSGVDVSRLGHGYYAAAHPVLYDIVQVLGGASNPGSRPRLYAMSSSGGSYWQLRQ